MQPWEAERVVGPDVARELIRAQMPQLSPKRIELLGEGWDNIAYRVDGEWVFRFPRRQLGADLIDVEAAVLPRLAGRLPLPVPNPIWQGKATEAFPWPFSGYSYLPGRPACRAELGEDARRAAAEPLGRFLAALHALPESDLDGAALPGDTIGRMDLSRRVPMARERLAKLATLGLIAAPDPWLPWLDSLPAGPRPSGLVHGDLYACHLLVDEQDRLSGVIDWGDVHRGDPAADLMIAYSFLPPAARPAFWRAYGSADEDTRRLARFRAIFHTATVALYALDVGDPALLREERRALDYTADGA